MGFIEKQIHALGLLMSFMVLTALLYLIYEAYRQSEMYLLLLLVVFVWVVACGLWGQIKFLKTPGFKYIIFSIPSWILSAYLAFFIR